MDFAAKLSRPPFLALQSCEVAPAGWAASLLRGGCRAVMVQTLRGWNDRSFSNTVLNIKAGVFTTTYVVSGLFCCSQPCEDRPRTGGGKYVREKSAAREGKAILVPIRRTAKPVRWQLGCCSPLSCCSLFTELPRRRVLGNWVSGKRSSRKPSCRFWAFSQTQRHRKGRGC